MVRVKENGSYEDRTNYESFDNPHGTRTASTGDGGRKNIKTEARRRRDASKRRGDNPVLRARLGLR